MTYDVEIQVLAWRRQPNYAGINRLLRSQPSPIVPVSLGTLGLTYSQQQRVYEIYYCEITSTVQFSPLLTIKAIYIGHRNTYVISAYHH
jgi:hypothetical protein